MLVLGTWSDYLVIYSFSSQFLQRRVIKLSLSFKEGGAILETLSSGLFSAVEATRALRVTFLDKFAFSVKHHVSNVCQTLDKLFSMHFHS